MLTENIDDVLRDYFTWATVNNPADIGYPHIEPVRRLLGGGLGSEGLSDEEAEFVDRALALLKSENLKSYKVIKAVYADQRSIRWMEQRGMGDRRALARSASEGREFLRGVMLGAVYAGLKSGATTPA